MQKILIGFLGVIPAISYAATCTETAQRFECKSTAKETVVVDDLNKGYHLKGGNATVNITGSNINLTNYNYDSVIDVWSQDQNLNLTGNNTINVSGDQGTGGAIRFHSAGIGDYRISGNLNINVDKPNAKGVAAIDLYTTVTTFNYSATGTIQTNAGSGIAVTAGGQTFLNNINSSSLKIITNANTQVNEAHHGVGLYGWTMRNAMLNLGTVGDNHIDINVQSGLGSAIFVVQGGANGVATIGSYNNDATGNITLSGGYGNVFTTETAGINFAGYNDTTSYTANIGKNVTVGSGNDAVIKAGKGDLMTVNNQGVLNGYVTTTENVDTSKRARLVLNNEASGVWNLSDFGDNGTTKGTITNNFNGGTLNNFGTIKFADKNFADKTPTNAIFNVGTFTNAGIIDLTGKNPSSKNDLVGDTFTINGNYVSDGGSIYLNTVLDDARSNQGQGTSDLVTITGNATTGTNGATKLYIVPTASSLNLGNVTVGNGIKVVDVKGASSADAFALGKKLVAGNYEYTLNQGKEDNSWYLSSYKDKSDTTPGVITYNPAIGAYLANQTAAVQMFQQTLFDRLISSSDGTNDASKNLFWMRTKMTHSNYDSAHSNFSNRTRSYTLQMGGDLNVWALNNGGYFHLGVMGGYGDFKDTSKSDTTGTKTDGKVKGYTAGVYGTYFANQDTNLGLYVDLWSQMGWYRNEISGEAQIGTKKYNSTVWSNSVELGYGIPLVNSGEYQWLATPQVQLTYNSYDADNQHDKNNLNVTKNNASGLDTRVGIRFHARGIKENLVEPFLEVNWLDTTAKNKLNFNGKAYKDGFAKDRLEAKIGLQGNINKRWSVSAQVGGQWGNNSYNSYQGQLNLNYKF